jgi:hypothetical protein
MVAMLTIGQLRVNGPVEPKKDMPPREKASPLHPV